ncbi:MAG: glycoside hydrolase family 5 protein, partial [Candidatus Limnocylindrales bacterium]
PWNGGVGPVRPVATNCVLDPNHLPPPPPSPDGRPANYLHTCGNRIYDSHGHEVKITGINWEGMEGSGYAPGGLGNRNWQSLLDEIARLGYNTVRIPFSNETIDSAQDIANVNFALNPDLEGLTGLEMLDRLIAGARARGLKVILDRHQPTSASGATLWYDSQVPQSRWIADWRMLAARYAGNDTVIGFDLANEPHGAATWGTGDPATDWRLAAEKAGNAVLSVNPYLLVFVEGVADYQGDHFWWGGNLDGVRTQPVRLHVPNRLVYSPHDYGPAISAQTWFSDPSFPRNLPAEWDKHWGYIQEEGIAPVVVGEFGGWSFGNDPDGKWQTTLLAYLKQHDIGFLIWSLNPSWDTGGILGPDWKTVNWQKQDAYHPLLAAPLSRGPTGTFGVAPSRVAVLFRQDGPGGQTDQIAFTARILNDGPTPVDLSQLELRYWFQAGSLIPSTDKVSLQTGDLNGATVNATVVPTMRGGQGYYLSIRFAPGSGTVAPYRATGDLRVQFDKPRSATLAQTADYSYAGTPSANNNFTEWNRVTLYRDGKLVWGREP